MNRKETRIHVISSSRCNNNCLFCADSKLRKTKIEDVDCQTIKNKLKRIFKLGIKGVLFTGNEPTLNKNLARMIKLAKKYRLH